MKEGNLLSKMEGWSRDTTQQSHTGCSPHYRLLPLYLLKSATRVPVTNKTKGPRLPSPQGPSLLLVLR